MTANGHLSEALVSVLEEVVGKEGFRRPRFTLCGGTKPGDNYVGVIHRVKVEESDEHGSKASLSLIVKRQPDSETRRNKFRTYLLFENEAVFYNHVIPTFFRFQQEKGIRENLSPPHARCLLAGDLLVMEDQSPLGFIMKDRRKPVDRAHCLLVMRELGRLHAISFALRDQKPALFQKLAAVVKETLLTPDMPDGIRKYFEVCGTNAYNTFEKHSSHPFKRKYLDTIKEISGNVSRTLVATVRREAAEPFAVITHGDCWTTNMLFKYMQNNSSVPEKVCFLDFQLTRTASPACDITYFLYCCTDRATRQAYYIEFLHHYHSSLAAHLARLGSDVNKLFPMEALQNQIKQFGSYGLCLAMVTVPMFTCDSEDIPDLDTACQGDDDDFVKTFNFDRSNDTHFLERLCDVIVDVVDLGYTL